MSNVHESTAERIRSYYPFEEGIVETVANVAADQATMDCDTFLNKLEVPEPQLVAINGSLPVSVLRILPQGDFDPARARVMDLGIGNGLMPNKNQIYQVATVFAAEPTVQTYAFGNPGGIKNREGLVTARQAIDVIRGDSRWLIDASSRILERDGITEVERRGYSYGVLASLTATEHADKYGMEVTHVTGIDPADVVDRGPNKLMAMKSLGDDFKSAGKQLQGYVDVNQIEAFVEARGDSAIGMANYMLGLLRLNNLARTSILANKLHESRVVSALEAQPDATMHTIWAAESELAKDAVMWALTTRLERRFRGRFDKTRIKYQTHLMVNDLALQSALYLHASPII